MPASRRVRSTKRSRSFCSLSSMSVMAANSVLNEDFAAIILEFNYVVVPARTAHQMRLPRRAFGVSVPAHVTYGRHARGSYLFR
jgi:hypothetical protein